MAEISAKDVMKLRNETGLPMMACKKALGEANGDFESAKDILRKSLKGKMESKSGRPAGEGRVEIAIASNGSAAAIVEIRAETDFTAKNDKFIEAARQVAKMALETGANTPTDDMKAIVDEVRIATGENCSIARVAVVNGGGDATFGSYLHHDGKTGVLIEAMSVSDTDVLRKIGMHITAAFPVPLGVTPDDIPAEMVEKERKFRIDTAVESGKPQEIAEMMVEGGMKKFYAEVALLEQDFVVQPGTKVKDLLGEGTITAFHRWQVGEGGDGTHA